MSATVAQVVEQLTCNQQVGGSNPSSGFTQREKAQKAIYIICPIQSLWQMNYRVWLKAVAEIARYIFPMLCILFILYSYAKLPNSNYFFQVINFLFSMRETCVFVIFCFNLSLRIQSFSQISQILLHNLPVDTLHIYRFTMLSVFPSNLS